MVNNEDFDAISTTWSQSYKNHVLSILVSSNHFYILTKNHFIGLAQSFNYRVVLRNETFRKIYNLARLILNIIIFLGNKL